MARSTSLYTAIFLFVAFPYLMQAFRVPVPPGATYLSMVIAALLFLIRIVRGDD